MGPEQTGTGGSTLPLPDTCGIVIVTHNSADVITECIRACLRYPNHRMLVVDNASSDDTVRLARSERVQVVANSQNRGFAGAANQGIGVLDVPFVLILNPDAWLQEGLAALRDAVSEPGVGAAGGRLVDRNGYEQRGFQFRSFPTVWTLVFEILGLNRLWPGNGVNQAYRFPELPQGTVEVDQPAGAFLMVRRTAWAEIGGFDESFYPVWFEDVDFCKRLRNAGYRIRHVPAAVARHVGGHAVKRLPWSSRQLFWYGSLLRYASKHFSTSARFAVAVTLTVGCFPRMLFGFLRARSGKPLSVYIRIVRMAAESLRWGERRPDEAVSCVVQEKSVRSVNVRQ